MLRRALKPIRRAREREAPGGVHHPREAARERGAARQVGDELVLEPVAVLLLIVVEELGLHPGHVDAGRALALAGLAADAQVERLVERRRGEGVGAELP